LQQEKWLEVTNALAYSSEDAMPKKLAVPNMAYNVRAAGFAIVTIIIKAMILQQSCNP
jgi:hypothetical protein